VRAQLARRIGGSTIVFANAITMVLVFVVAVVAQKIGCRDPSDIPLYIASGIEIGSWKKKRWMSHLSTTFSYDTVLLCPDIDPGNDIAESLQ
jgi:hypothetical protein